MSEKEVLKRIKTSTLSTLIKMKRVSVVGEEDKKSIRFLTDKIYNYDYYFFGVWGAYKEKNAPVTAAEVFRYINKNFDWNYDLGGCFNMNNTHQNLHKFEKRGVLNKIKLPEGSILWSPTNVALYDLSFKKIIPKSMFRRDVKNIYADKALTYKEDLLQEIEFLIRDEGLETAKFFYDRINEIFLKLQWKQKSAELEKIKGEMDQLVESMNKLNKV